VSGEPYETFIQTNILAPLQMGSTGFNLNNLVLPRRALAYTATGVPVSAGSSAFAFPNAAYGMYSTVEDLFRWDEALGQGALSQKLWTAMFTPYEDITSFFSFPSSFSSVGVGYGWFIAKDANRQLVFYDDSPENLDGFAIYNGRYLDDKVTVIALGNQPADANQTDIGAALAALVFARH
jgi:CubicO group peptidase (beta-lactamase class C family)